MQLFTLQTCLIIALALGKLVDSIEIVTLNTVEVVNKFDGVLTSSVLEAWGYSEETSTSLQLANKKIHTVHKDAFSGFKCLEYVDLSFNQLSELNSTTALNIFSNLKSTGLKTLKLNNNQMKAITVENLFDPLKELQHLDLSYNQLKRIDEYHFKGLQNLQHLNLKMNKISIVDAKAFANLKNLVHLDMKLNFLSSLSESTFAALVDSLSYLDLSSNQLQSLESGLFKGLTSLFELNLSDNLIKSVPADLFMDLNQLHKLHMSYNQLKTLDLNSFSGLNNLLEMYLEENMISNIFADTFKSMTKLLDLDLSNNDLNSIEDFTLKGLQSLTTLNLAFNNIVTIKNNAFGHFDRFIQNIYLNSNKLKTLDLNLLRNMRGLRYLHLYDNDDLTLSASDMANLMSLTNSELQVKL